MSGSIGSIFRWWKEGHGHNGDARIAPTDNGNGAVRISIPTSVDPAQRASIDHPWLATLERAGPPRNLRYPSTALGRIIDQTADRFGNSIAVIYNHKTWTYHQLAAQVNRMAGGLARLGVRANDRVVMTLPNCPEFIISFFAIQKLGAVVVNAGPLMGADDMRTLIAMTSPRVVIGLDLRAPVLANAGKASTVEHWVWVSLQSYQSLLKRLGYQWKLWQARETAAKSAEHITLAQLLADAPARPPSLEPDVHATAVLQPTGGTTGTLKLAQLSHASLLANAMQVLAWLQSPIGQERVLSVLPMFHVYGLTTALIQPLFSGATLILMTRFAAGEAVDLLKEFKATAFPLVPAICDAISDEMERREEPTALKGLRMCFSGAAPLTKEVARRFERLTGARVIEGYGLTEASPVTHANLPGQPRYGSIGLPMPDTDCRVVDLEDGSREVKSGEPGELLVAGPQLMSGYFANLEETHRALVKDEFGRTWLHTGDVVRVDEDGYFYVLDRKKDMIIHSGLKIFPCRVEHVLREHAQVADVAVVGQSDPVHTEQVVAFVVSKRADEDRQKLATELRKLCHDHLASYEVPARFKFVAEIPRSPLGKVLKRELRRLPVTGDSGDWAENDSGPDPHPTRETTRPKEAA